MRSPREFESKGLRKYQRPGGAGIPVNFTTLFNLAANRGQRHPEGLWKGTALWKGWFVEGHGFSRAVRAQNAAGFSP
jgi:hypothetical protein